MINEKYKNGIIIKSIEGSKILKAKGKLPVNNSAVFSYSMLFDKLNNDVADEKEFILRSKSGYYTDDIINVSFSFGLNYDEVKELNIEGLNEVLEKNNKRLVERKERLTERRNNNLKKLDEVKAKKDNEYVRHDERLEKIETTAKTINREYDKNKQINKENEMHNKRILKYSNRIKKLEEELEKVEKSLNKEVKPKGISKDTVRKYLYKGFNIECKDKTIKYKMWFRSSAKARVGEVLFINEKYYDEIIKWQRMGIEFKEGEECKLVEMMAYQALTSSSIEGYLDLNPNNILVIDDMYSSCNKLVNEVVLEDGKCKVIERNKEVGNTLFDGQALLDDSLFENKAGMMLLRHHFFKACGFRTNIQLFMKDYCDQNGLDYETHTVKDRYGNYIKVKDIKLITTENAMKWEKFFNNKTEGFNVWKKAVNEDGNRFGVCKEDHPSKMGDLQWMSYQMVNSLLTNKEETRKLFKTTADYINGLKDDDNFKDYLKRTKSEVNSNEMIIDLLEVNPKFVTTDVYRDFKKKEINELKDSLKEGKVLQNADNLTVVGNPYLMLKASVGNRELEDETLPPATKDSKENYITVYTKRFKDREYLGAFRNPHNASNNVLYFKNHHNEDMGKYFNFSNNIIAVNLIKNDAQDRGNGFDEDSDFFYTTNNQLIVEKAKEFYTKYPTIVNSIPKKDEDKPYTNTIENMANIDNTLAKGKADIGVSSNLAQVALSYYADNGDSEMLDTVVIMSVLAQVAIDSAKKEYEVNVANECRRLQIKEEVEYTNKDGEKKIKKVSVKKPLFFKYTQPEKLKNLMTPDEEIEYKEAKEEEYKRSKEEVTDESEENIKVELIEIKVRERLKNEHDAKEKALEEQFENEWKENYKKVNSKEYTNKHLPKKVKKEIKDRAKIEANIDYNFKLQCPMNHMQYIIEEDIKNDTRGMHKDKTIPLLSLIGKVEGKAKKEHMETIIDRVNEWNNKVVQLHLKEKKGTATDDDREEFDKEEIIIVENLNETIKKLKLSKKTIQMLIKNSLLVESKKASISHLRLKLFRTLHKNFKGQFLKLFK